MLTLNDTALNDNQIIWVLRITDESTEYYLSDIGITLSSNDYNGKTLSGDYPLGSLEKSIDIEVGGGVGDLGSFDFSVTKYADSTDWDGFIDEWFPNTSKYLTNRLLEVGFLWDGATTEGEITWVMSFIIEGISWDSKTINFQCVEHIAAYDVELPRYTLQKTHNDGVSYFKDVPPDYLGSKIPIVYGKFADTVSGYLDKDFVAVPALCVSATDLAFIVASHKCNAYATSNLKKFSSELSTYISLSAEDTTGSVQEVSNTEAGAMTSLIGVRNGGFVYGQLYLYPSSNPGNFSDGSTSYAPTRVVNSVIMDQDGDTYMDLDAGEGIFIMFDVSDAERNIMEQTCEKDNIALKILCQSLGTSSINGFVMVVRRMSDITGTPPYTLDGGSFTKSFTAGTSKAMVTIDPLFSTDRSLSELANFSSIYLENNDSTEKMRIYLLHYDFQKFVMPGIIKRSYMRDLDAEITNWDKQADMDYMRFPTRRF